MYVYITRHLLILKTNLASDNKQEIHHKKLSLSSRSKMTCWHMNVKPTLRRQRQEDRCKI